jgi:hypothetical protein
MASLIDIQAFQLQPDGQVVQALANERTSGETVDSTLKLVQKVIVTLLTQTGSVPYLPSQGTNFMNRFLTGAFINDQDVFVNFAAASVAVKQQLTIQQTTADGTDEQYVRSVVEKVFIAPEGILMQIRIDTKNTIGTSVLLPLQFQVH